MRIVAFTGSLRERSATRSALEVACRGARRAGAEVAWLDLHLSNLPICDGRKDSASYGELTARLVEQVGQADALLVASPEYYGSMSGALKNTIDLLGPDPLRGKMVGLLAGARGDAGAMNTLNHLRHVFRWVGAWVLPTQVSIPRASEAFDGAGDPIREGLEDELLLLGKETVRYARLLAGDGLGT